MLKLGFVFLPELHIGSWNMCNFSAVHPHFDNKTKKDQGKDRKWTEDEKGLLSSDTRDAFQYLANKVDVLVLQEFHSNMNQIKMIRDWMPLFDSAVAEDGSEHVFLWRRDRIRPFKRTDLWIMPLVTSGLKRPAGTMRLVDLATATPFTVTSFHLKSGGGEETRAEFRALLGGYRAQAEKRYGIKDTSEYMHILAGDVNLNPHLEKNPVLTNWVATGHSLTRTSGAGKGYDFFFVDPNTAEEREVSQRTLRLRRPKNSALSRIGVSDHHPIVLSIV